MLFRSSSALKSSQLLFSSFIDDAIETGDFRQNTGLVWVDEVTALGVQEGVQDVEAASYA